MGSYEAYAHHYSSVMHLGRIRVILTVRYRWNPDHPSTGDQSVNIGWYYPQMDDEDVAEVSPTRTLLWWEIGDPLTVVHLPSPPHPPIYGWEVPGVISLPENIAGLRYAIEQTESANHA